MAAKTLALENEHHIVLRPVLARLERLRQAYGSLHRDSPAASSEALRQALAALRDPRVRHALDPLLEREQNARPLAAPKSVIEREAELGELFGFSAREMKSHIRAVAGGQAQTIRNISDLQRLLRENHDAALAEIDAAQNLSWLKRRRALRVARDRAETGVYRAGSIVADGLHRELFPHSYAFATKLPLGAES